MVVCHPHPEYGGDMDNPVVMAAVGGCVESGWAALRFNFGGVGRSGGRYGGGPDEVRDVAAAVAALRAVAPGVPLGIAGYSFGAWVGARAACDLVDVRLVIAIAPPMRIFDWGFASGLAAPLSVIVGDRDGFCPGDRLAALPCASISRLAGADHFLAGRDAEIASAVAARL